MGDAVALISAMIECRFDSNKSVKWAPNWGPLPWTSSSVGMEFAVVNQRPGSWGASAFGSVGMEVGNEIWRDRDKAGLREI